MYKTENDILQFSIVRLSMVIKIYGDVMNPRQ